MLRFTSATPAAVVMYRRARRGPSSLVVVVLAGSSCMIASAAFVGEFRLPVRVEEFPQTAVPRAWTARGISAVPVRYVIGVWVERPTVDVLTH